MTSVKVPSSGDDAHIAMLAGSFLGRVNADFDPDRWGGLRISQIRVVTVVPPGGTTVTELAGLVRMTKQGCGQFVAQLVLTGHLRVEPDPDDRRLRRVHRTAAGDALMGEVATYMRELDRTFAEEVGVRRYATFRAVLRELGLARRSDPDHGVSGG